MRDYETAIFIEDCRERADERGYVTREDVYAAFEAQAQDTISQIKRHCASRGRTVTDQMIRARFTVHIFPGLAAVLASVGIAVRDHDPTNPF